MKRRSKYGVAPKELRTTQDGIEFDSRGEMKRYQDLRLWVLAGEIRNLQRQVKFELASPDGKHRVLTATGKQAFFTADFVYERRVYEPLAMPSPTTPQEMERAINPPMVRTEKWIEVIEDFKGMTTREAALRIRVLEALTGKKVTITGKRTRG